MECFMDQDKIKAGAERIVETMADLSKVNKQLVTLEAVKASLQDKLTTTLGTWMIEDKPRP